MASMVVFEIVVISGIKIARDYTYLSGTMQGAQLSSELKKAAGLDLNRTLLYIYASTVIWSAINYGRFQRRTAEALLKSILAEKANTDLQFQFAQAQNAFLKQQINPHLLFNTLNAIYGTVYRHSPEDSEAVLLLSEIMRYSYEEPDDKGLVALENELYHLKTLVKLNTYRFKDTARLNFQLTGKPANLRIIPLVLLTLTENMFKHGDMQKIPGSIEISIGNDSQLSYTSKNIRKVRGRTRTNTNIGLNNTRLRLDYAYPGNYTLEITETDETFNVNLQMNLAYERSNHR